MESHLVSFLSKKILKAKLKQNLVQTTSTNSKHSLAGAQILESKSIPGPNTRLSKDPRKDCT